MTGILEEPEKLDAAAGGDNAGFCVAAVYKSQAPAKRRKQELTPGIKQKAAMGFEPMNNGFANHRLSPLGHAAEKNK